MYRFSIYKHIHIYTHTYIHIHIHAYTYIQIHTNTYTHIHTHIYIRSFIYLYTFDTLYPILRVYGTLTAHALHVAYENLVTRTSEGSPKRALLLENQAIICQPFPRRFSPYFYKRIFNILSQAIFPIQFPIVGPGSAYTFNTYRG